MADRNVRRLDDADFGPQEWLRSLPIITRCWFASAVGTTIGANFGIVSPRSLLYSFPHIRSNFEIWRCVTPFLYVGKFELNTLIGLYMLYQFSKQYEAGGPYNTGAGGGTADYAFALLFAIVITVASFHLLRGVLPLSPLFVRNLVFFVLYVWSKRNPTSNANIWGVPLKAVYLPFGYLALNILLGNPYFDVLHGILVGHLYYFLVDVVPLVYNRDVLHTPQFLIDIFGMGEYVPPVAATAAPGNAGAGGRNTTGPGRVGPPHNPAMAAAAGARRTGGGGHHWGGGGRRLGDS